MFNTQKITTRDVIEVKSALRALLRSRYPDINAEQASSVDDILLAPMSYLAAAIKADAETSKRNMYLADLEQSTSSDALNILRDLASNFAVDTYDLPSQKGLVTFRFTSSIPRTIPADITLTRGDNYIIAKLFDTSSDVAIDESDYLVIEESGTTYYDFSILAETVASSLETMVSAGEFAPSQDLVDLHSVFNTGMFVGLLRGTESPNSVSERIRYAQVSRGFTTKNSITATILDEGIPNIVRVVPIGAGDPEMMRDVIPTTISSSEFHSLGMINVVVISTLQSKVIQLPESLTLGGSPILGVKRYTRGGSQITVVSDFGTTRFYKSYDPVSRATTIGSRSIASGQELLENEVSISCSGEEVYLNGSSSAGKFSVSGGQSGDTIEVITDPNIPVCQGLVDSDTYNTLGSSVKSIGGSVVEVIIPSLSITSAPGISPTQINVARVSRLVSEYFTAWEDTYPPSLSGLLAKLSLQLAGLISYISLPSGVDYVVNLPDGSFVCLNTTDSITVESDAKYPTDSGITYEAHIKPLQVSDRVLNYFCGSDNVAVEVL